MIYKVLCVLLLACSFIQAATVQEVVPVHIVDNKPSPKGLLVFDDDENSVPENLEDLEISTASSNDTSPSGFPSLSENNEEIIGDPYEADTSRNPSLRPDIHQHSNQQSHQNLTTNNFPTYESPDNTEEDISDEFEWETLNEHTEEPNFFADIFEKFKKVKEGIDKVLQSGKGLFW